MYLLNTLTYQLQHFNSEEDVKYAILSHRWGAEEVLFRDMRDFASCHKAGAQKIKSFCRLLRRHSYYDTPRLEWCWVDTCCINKESSAELSEAINSMYRWYEKSSLCVAFLSDVTARPIDRDFEDQLAASCWFTRCWTLQELIAPRNLHFCNAEWLDIGSQKFLLMLISDITSIPAQALAGSDLDDFSVAQRMSWAANRHATRKEDEAYSLMGIFRINMPMLYGEGARAFERLQEEIIRYNDDHTIFAWQKLPQGALSSGLLALSPLQFEGCGDVESATFPLTTSSEKGGKDNFILTNKGLTADLHLRGMWWHTSAACLNAVIRRSGQPDKWIGVALQRFPLTDEYRRCAIRKELHDGKMHYLSHTEVLGDEAGYQWQHIIVNHRRKRTALCGKFPCGFDMRSTIFSQNLSLFPSRCSAKFEDILKYHYVQPSPSCENDWNIVKDSIVISRAYDACSGPICNIHFTDFSRGIKLLQFGLSLDLEPVCILVPIAYGSSQTEQTQRSSTRPSYEDIRSFKVNYTQLPTTPFRTVSLNLHVMHQSDNSSPLLVICGDLSNYQRYQVSYSSGTCRSSCCSSLKGFAFEFRKSAHQSCDYWTLNVEDLESPDATTTSMGSQIDDPHVQEFLGYFKVQTQIQATIEKAKIQRSKRLERSYG